MKKKYRYLLYLLGIAAIIILFCLVDVAPSKKEQIDRRFQWLSSHADKIEISYYTKPHTQWKKFSIAGTDIKLLCACFVVKIPWHGEYYKCFGNPKIEFFYRNEFLDSFTLLHGEMIHWDRYKIGDIPLTEASQKNLKEFFAKHALPPMVDDN